MAMMQAEPKHNDTGMHLAMENFFYTASRLQLPAMATLAELEAAGTKFCATPWQQLYKEHVKLKATPPVGGLLLCWAVARW